MVSKLESTHVSERWTDALLDSMRLKGDPPADRVIQALFTTREVKEARRLLRTLVENDQPPPQGLPPEVIDYLNTVSAPVAASSEAIERGQELFVEHGPIMLMCLGCYSLPASYAAAKGVKVLHRTAYLERRPTKRLFETTQMVIDVMTPGGLEPGGRGVRTIQKVRLMHAMVRYMIQNDHSEPWPTELGVPINQEDLAGTLMAFVWGTLDGLHKLGLKPSVGHQEDYLAAWRIVGRLMGVDEVLLPQSVAEAGELKRRIEERQIGPSEEGRVLTRALLELMARNAEIPLLQDLPAALMRHFLPGPVSDFLEIPRHRFDVLAVEALKLLAQGKAELVEESPTLARVARTFSVHLIRWMVKVQLGGRSAPFVVPLELERRWGLRPEPTFLQRLEQWFSRSWRRIFGTR